MSQEKNDLFYLCSLIEFIARTTTNTKKEIVTKIGKDGLTKLFSLASILHVEPIEKISEEIIKEYNIKQGNYVKHFQNKIPTHWDIGKVYQRLIIMNSPSGLEYINTLIEVLTSWIILKIDNYDSSMYYENPSYIYECYKEGQILPN